MGFWLYMLAMVLLIPLVMMIFGRYFMKNAPKKINPLFGYRTARSMKNRGTWEFAHRYFGKLWFVCGSCLLPLSATVLLFLTPKTESMVGTAGGLLCFLQLVVLAGCIFPTERALKKAFDRNGNRR